MRIPIDTVLVLMLGMALGYFLACYIAWAKKNAPAAKAEGEDGSDAMPVFARSMEWRQ